MGGGKGDGVWRSQNSYLEELPGLACPLSLARVFDDVGRMVRVEITFQVEGISNVLCWHEG